LKTNWEREREILIRRKLNKLWGKKKVVSQSPQEENNSKYMQVPWEPYPPTAKNTKLDLCIASTNPWERNIRCTKRLRDFYKEMDAPQRTHANVLKPQVKMAESPILAELIKLNLSQDGKGANSVENICTFSNKARSNNEPDYSVWDLSIPNFE